MHEAKDIVDLNKDKSIQIKDQQDLIRLALLQLTKFQVNHRKIAFCLLFHMSRKVFMDFED